MRKCRNRVCFWPLSRTSPRNRTGLFLFRRERGRLHQCKRSAIIGVG